MTVSSVFYSEDGLGAVIVTGPYCSLSGFTTA